ncbi:MAG TPA: shikimate kinase [bacterium]|nr:shikimate kinase [bacterium]
MPNVYLTGMMGSGKTVAGEHLSLLLHFGFIDLDGLISEKTKRTVSELFEKEGEAFFRAQETQALKEVSVMNSKVVATGGGTVLNPVNIQRMKGTGKVVYLETSLDELWERVKEKKDRPLLKSDSPKEALRKIYELRQPIYERICDVKVNTDRKSIESIARQIVKALEQSS